jgi:ribA/ribD-fused uncharacterized protein
MKDFFRQVSLLIKHKNAIREADTSHKAFLLGRMGGNIRHAFVINKKNNPTKILGLVKKSKGTVKRRADWDEVKDVLMIVGLFAKFTQNKDLYDKLLSTGDAKIVEYSPVDKYWGTYWDKKGKNRLGKSLMKVRSCLKLADRKDLAKFSKTLNWEEYI